MPDRRAFTVVEVLVAVVLVSVGLLALMSTAAWATRMITAGHRLIAEAALAGRHLAAYRVGPCTVAGAGGRVGGRHEVRWSSAPGVGGLAVLTLTVTSVDGGRRVESAFTTVRPC